MKFIHLFSILLTLIFTSHSAKAEDFQLSDSNDFLQSSNYFSRSAFSYGLSSFLKDIFNAPGYAQDFLPNNFDHFIELLEYGKKSGKDVAYMKSVIRLFSNKMKASAYINAYAFDRMLQTICPLLEPYVALENEEPIFTLKDIIYELQCQSFKNQFPEFKSNPESFLSKLSQSIEDAAELRKLITLFLEISLAKLVWSPEDQEITWYTTKSIADSLAMLHKSTAIADLEDLNSVCITLLERYCLFLDIAQPYLTALTFEKIKEDISTCRTPLLDIEEQEDVLESKLHRLTRCISQLEARTRAVEAGILLR